MNDLLDPRVPRSRPDSDDLESLMSPRAVHLDPHQHHLRPRLVEPDRQRLHAMPATKLRRLEMEPDAEHAKLMTTSATVWT